MTMLRRDVLFSSSLFLEISAHSYLPASLPEVKEMGLLHDLEVIHGLRNDSYTPTLRARRSCAEVPPKYEEGRVR